MWRNDAPWRLLNRMLLNEQRDALGRIFDKIEVLPNECWGWQGAVFGGNRSPSMNFGRTALSVRRYLYVQYTGMEELEENTTNVTMTCETPLCVNPAHMRPISRQVGYKVQFPEIADRRRLLQWYVEGNRTRVKITLDEYYELERRGVLSS